MKTLTGGLVAIALLFGQSNAFAASHQQSNINRLFEAVNYVVQADTDAYNGDSHRAESRLRIASYRVRIVLASIRYEHGLAKAVEALEVTNQKIMDPYLSIDEKLYFAIDCLAVAIPELIRQQARFTGNNRAALESFRLARTLSGTHVFGPIEKVLQSAKRYLRPVGCPIASSGIRKALEAVNVAIDKVTDVGLSDDEKEFFVLDCLNVAERALRGF